MTGPGPDQTGHDQTVEALTRAERHLDEHRYAEAFEALRDVHVPSASAPDLALRVVACETWARLYPGDLETADAVAERGRALSGGASFTDSQRADALFRLGPVHLKRARVSNAVSLFTLAIRLAERGGPSGERVRSRALEWRSRCCQLQREWEAAQSDAEAAVDLAVSAGDRRLEALAKIAVLARRRAARGPVLARFYAERARTLAAQEGERQTEARIVDNLGGLSFVLGEPEVAVSYLKASFAMSLETGNDADAAQTVLSLARAHLGCGGPQLAEEQLVLGRAARAVARGREVCHMKKRVNVLAVMLFLIAPAMVVARVNWGGGYVFSSGG